MVDSLQYKYTPLCHWGCKYIAYLTLPPAPATCLLATAHANEDRSTVSKSWQARVAIMRCNTWRATQLQ